jgi:cysteine desulfurase
VHTIYMDHNATTPTDPRVVEAMLPYFTTDYGNPSSAYGLAQETRRAVERARHAVADALETDPRSIVFTSGGSESDNIAIKGAVVAALGRGGHVITSRIEHHAVLRTCQYVRERYGVDVTFVGVDAEGLVDPAEVADACRDDTLLISIMLANNDVGTIEPLAEIGQMSRVRGIPFHTDAVQAVGKIPVAVDELGVDLLAMSAHKFYGPKGVGALYVRQGTRFDPLSHGGNQEWGLRAGTENVPGIVGLATALELAVSGMEPESVRLRSLTERLERGVLERIPDVAVHARGAVRIPGTTNIAFHYVEGESMVLALDMEGVAVSTGSACTTDSAEPSHVLSAMGVAPNVAQGSVRFGLGRHTTTEDVDRVLTLLPPIVERLRAMSPLYRPSEQS